MTKTNLEIEEEFDKKFNWFYPCNEPHCGNMCWQGDINELKEWIFSKLQQRMDEIEGEVKNIKVFATSGVRQLGFLYIAKCLPEVEYIITLDDEDFEIKAEICTAVWEKVFKPKVLNIIKSVDKNNEN